jgi:hemolysin III
MKMKMGKVGQLAVRENFGVDKVELVNSIIHALGILFGIVAIPVLTSIALKANHLYIMVGAAVYGLSFLMVFTFSTLYHGFQVQRVKQTFKILDHISIYFLISGTYTPFLLRYMFNQTGITVLIILWSLTVVGTIYKIFYVDRHNVFSTIVYLIMGWTFVLVGDSFFASMPHAVSSLINLGAILYSIGVVFYLWKKWSYNHAIWHVLVLTASIFHYLAVLIAVSNTG